MADDRSRAQLVLAAALLIAALLVAMALVLNSVLVTQNRATQPGPSATDPDDYRDATVEHSRAALGRINRDNADNDSHATLEDRFASDLDAWQNDTSRQYAVSGRAATVSVVSVDPGTRIRQTDAERAVTSAAGDANWTLARDVEQVHRFELNLSVDTLFEADGDTNVSTLRAEALQVTVNRGLLTWRVYLFRNASRNELDVLVGDPGELAPEDDYGDFGSQVCAGGGGNATVRIADAVVDGSPCGDLLFLAALSDPYTVSYNRSTGNEGTFDVFVGNDAVDGGPYAPMGSGQPFRQTALFAATVEIAYRDAAVDYTSATEVSPEPAPH